MKPLYSRKQFQMAKSRDLLPLECEYCTNTFMLQKNFILRALKNPNLNRGKYCSRKCLGINIRPKRIKTNCANCTKLIAKQPSQYKKTKNHFCSLSCAATYNITHKTTGTKRSKLEAWIETQLTTIYPQLPILFNSKEQINSELDIYIPSLKLAFELNGIFHYEPIYGLDKLSQIQNNDCRKFQACLEQGIELCIIDTSSQSYFKEKSSKKFLNIITSILNSRLASL